MNDRNVHVYRYTFTSDVLHVDPHMQKSHRIPLLAAAEEGHTQIVERLLDEGAIINYQGKVHMRGTYIHLLCYFGHSVIIQ